jgi:endonuclease-3
MKKEKFIKIFEILKKEYPDAKCSLNFTTPFEILVAVALSAQCTDERVNKVTAEIFPKYNTPEDFANLPLEDIEKMIHSCGFYRNKAKNLKLASQKILKDFNGDVPNTMEELMTIPGIGRKSANVIMLEAFNNPQGIAVDTHVKRLSNRIGFSKEKDPEKIEKDLLKVLPKKYYSDANHILILHGRNVCKAQKPNCKNCCINSLCKSFK